MEKLLIIALILISSFVKAQEERGIKFEQGLTWAQIKEKARIENKYIFLDGYTTWCGPCKMMAKEIFPQASVGKFFNRNFINVAVQFDKTKNDNAEIKSWYKDAEILQETYKVSSYPTYLFFNPKGELVHTILGASATAADFISKAKVALSPDKQHYTLKRQYEAGKKDPDFLLLLINTAQLANDNKFIPVVINEYLAIQQDLLTEENIKFLLLSTTKSTDPGFPILRDYAAKVDSIGERGKSTDMINDIVFDEIVLPYLRDGGIKTIHGPMVVYSGSLNENINWAEIKQKVDIKYPQLSEEIIMSAKPVYYSWLKNWPAFRESVSAYVSKYESRISSVKLNSYARTILTNSEDLNFVNSALDWSKKTLLVAPKNISFLFTYANLLYKSGNKEDAIKNLQEAVNLSGGVNDGISETIKKMENGLKTW
ncbi:MAG TPA: thioredoxin fold domain-containing protein [Sphingobacteriaceae bacterium]|nr:thioredoxin fold domain-containing protein [Sphingobacteriaceae bacterium]